MSSDIFSSEIFEQPPARARKAEPLRMPRPADEFQEIPLTPPTAEDNQVYQHEDGVIHRRGV